jgi:SAM-dependent methyltransferase
VARIEYDETAAAAFAVGRHLPPAGLVAWREAIERYTAPRPGARFLDLGSGTGTWAAAFREWYGVEVAAVEPSAAMRARSTVPVLAGSAEAIPLPDGSVDAVWLSTVVHHVPDLHAAAREVRRVLRPGAPVLIRSAFAGRPERIGLFEFFPEAVRVLDTFPSVAGVCRAFEGFEFVALEPVPQVTAGSLAEVLSTLDRDAHTPLRLITDAEYEAGVARLRAAARTRTGPVVDALDLLVLVEGRR